VVIASGARAAALQAPGGGQVRALAIGVNDYRAFRPLRGAVADAQDLAGTLRRLGVQDVTLLTDAAASRDAVMAAADALTKRLGKGDLVVLSVAGHGAQEPEKVKGSEPDGNEEVFLLAGFDPSTGPGSRERVLDKEFNVLVKRMEERGATVLFVADTCHGGGLAREADPRGAELVYRQVPRYAISDDELKPIATEADAFLTTVDFQRSVFLAAVDKMSKAPEVKIPDVPGWRGALSYAVARAAEGAADADRDGQVTLAELYAYVRQVANQLTDQRQNVVTINAPSLNLRSSAVFREAGAAGTSTSSPEPAKAPGGGLDPVTVAALDGQVTWFADMRPRSAPLSVVAPEKGPDLVWDPRTGDLLAGVDVVARNVGVDAVAGAADRFAVVREIKRSAGRPAQQVRMAPDDRLQHAGALAEIQIPDVAGRALAVFNLAGDGTVQLLYPLKGEPPVPNGDAVRLPVRVSPPYGADQVVAVSAADPMPQLVQALAALDGTRNAGKVVDLLGRFMPPDARLGTTAIFTAPRRRKARRTRRGRPACA
jgi:uncharacterized caspase-like protein